MNARMLGSGTMHVVRMLAFATMHDRGSMVQLLINCSAPKAGFVLIHLVQQACCEGAGGHCQCLRARMSAGDHKS